MIGATQLELVGAVAAPSGVLLGVVVKGLFDRAVRRATASRVDAEAKLAEAQIPKLDAEAAKVIADTAVALVAPLRVEINTLGERVAKLEAENATTTGQLRRAVNYIGELLRWIAIHAPERTPPKLPDGLGILT